MVLTDISAARADAASDTGSNSDSEFNSNSGLSDSFIMKIGCTNVGQTLDCFCPIVKAFWRMVGGLCCFVRLTHER